MTTPSVCLAGLRPNISRDPPATHNRPLTRAVQPSTRVATLAPLLRFTSLARNFRLKPGADTYRRTLVAKPFSTCRIIMSAKPEEQSAKKVT